MAKAGAIRAGTGLHRRGNAGYTPADTRLDRAGWRGLLLRAFPNRPGARPMAQPLSGDCLDTIFLTARTHSAWLPKPVDDDTLRRVYDLAKLPPTSANTSPARFVFVK